MSNQTNPWIKWSLTAVMFFGAIITSLKLSAVSGFFLLFFGNTGWALVQFRMREWAAAMVFVFMAGGWALGIIKYFFF